MRNIKLIISYDGTNYSGWQRQINAPTVQGEIEKALKRVMKKDIIIHGSGRTDAGVHALGQTASFKANFTIPVDRIPIALNTILPEDIVIVSAQEMDLDFHARYSVKKKRYKYKIYNNSIKNPLYRNYTYFVPYSIDLEKIRDTSKHFIGEHDFRAFMASGSSVKSTIRRIDKIDIYKENEFIVFDFLGNGFLYNMVRIITGTLLDVSLNKINKKDIKEIIASKDRSKAGHTAPPQGLYLVEVIY